MIVCSVCKSHFAIPYKVYPETGDVMALCDERPEYRVWYKVPAPECVALVPVRKPDYIENPREREWDEHDRYEAFLDRWDPPRLLAD